MQTLKNSIVHALESNDLDAIVALAKGNKRVLSLPRPEFVRKGHGDILGGRPGCGERESPVYGCDSRKPLNVFISRSNNSKDFIPVCARSTIRPVERRYR